MTLGQLWLGLLKFYAYSFSHNEHAVCVRSLEPLLRSTKNWGNRRIAIEDPFHGNVNMGSFMSTSQTFDFFMDCMRNLFHYFWIPHTANGPLFVHLLLPGEEKNEDPIYCTPAEALRRMAELKTEDVKWEFEPEKILRSKKCVGTYSATLLSEMWIRTTGLSLLFALFCFYFRVNFIFISVDNQSERNSKIIFGASMPMLC